MYTTIEKIKEYNQKEIILPNSFEIDEKHPHDPVLVGVPRSEFIKTNIISVLEDKLIYIGDNYSSMKADKKHLKFIDILNVCGLWHTFLICNSKPEYNNIWRKYLVFACKITGEIIKLDKLYKWALSNAETVDNDSLDKKYPLQFVREVINMTNNSKDRQSLKWSKKIIKLSISKNPSIEMRKVIDYTSEAFFWNAYEVSESIIKNEENKLVSFDTYKDVMNMAIDISYEELKEKVVYMLYKEFRRILVNN